MYSVCTLVEPNRNLYIVCVVYFDILRENFIYTYFYLEPVPSMQELNS